MNDDIDNPGDQRSATISHAASGGGYDSVSVDSVAVTVLDDDTAVDPGGDGGDGDRDRVVVLPSGVSISATGLITWKHTATNIDDAYWLEWLSSDLRVELTGRKAATRHLENLGDDVWHRYGINWFDAAIVPVRDGYCDHGDGLCRYQIPDFDVYQHYLVRLEIWVWEDSPGFFGDRIECCTWGRFTPPEQPPRPQDPPKRAAISASGRVTWQHASGYRGSYRLEWAESESRLGAIYERGWYGSGVTRQGDETVRASNCDANGTCHFQIDNFDPAKHYLVSINTTRRDYNWQGAPTTARHDP